MSAFKYHTACSSAGWRRIVVLLLPVFLANCAVLQTGAYREGEINAVSDLLYFGTEKPGGSVTPSDWRTFVDDVVAIRFPDGFTWWDGIGQWRGPDGSVTREVSYILQIVHPVGPDRDDAVREIIEAYKRRFEQKAVLQLRMPACASF